MRKKTRARRRNNKIKSCNVVTHEQGVELSSYRTQGTHVSEGSATSAFVTNKEYKKLIF